MNLESLTDKQLHEMERLLTELTHLMKQGKLTEDPLYSELVKLKSEAGTNRQKRFDENNSRFQGY
jgi:hypothetical protein